jgi:hypothetical protein
MFTSLALASLTAIATAQSVYSGKADGLSQHTIYMPTNAPGKIPVLIWGSGGCQRDGMFHSSHVLVVMDLLTHHRRRPTRPRSERNSRPWHHDRSHG